ncbi:MAG: cell division ATP-binding protein FtsE [Nitrospirae bacterium RBG_16_43_8]|nr:MAG: cell division ATP-binding protein FtsE [Nitrospirae bacterium RBG_16_43_8]
MIHFSNVTKFYERQAALKNITFSIEKGEMVFMTGPSGAGKSTLLKIIYLSEKPDEGSVTIAEWDLSKLKESRIPFLRRNIGVVFQDFRLLDNRDVFDNVAIALRIRGMLDSEIQDWVMEVLKMVNLRHKADSFPRALSGGEQQRVVIARAIVGEPTIFLADEPTGNLDPDTAAGITRLFKEINARGTTVVIATHNRELYRNTGRKVFRIDGGNMVGEEIG